MKKLIGKADIIVICSLLFLALSLLLIILLFNQRGLYVTVTVNNEKIISLPLNENAEYPIENEYGSNYLVIEDGYAYIRDADCRDEICVRTGRINKVNEIIVCLPHKLVISIEDGNEN
ncbi:MAG: NusG domain II-containing protein [Clostridia bacterium]|nr:NusG domain II-containing protein [Clostridia bacterium]